MTDQNLDLTPVAPPKAKGSSRRRSIGVMVVIVAAIVALLSQGVLHSLNYFDTVDQVFAHRATIGTTTIRLEGDVKPHTITRTSSGASFWITGSGTREVYVVSHGSPPQLFQANIPVVVVGHFTSSHGTTFDGTQILVKHTSSYIAQHPKRVKAPNGSVR
ncbi:MAG TPA: cytochrome c maturation protein CcmE [Acidimicrobiales bacterium]